tara:strand:- start:1571 stop:2200 length:630 start_codon:yes stop_codon:yes gene_type:complete
MGVSGTNTTTSTTDDSCKAASGKTPKQPTRFSILSDGNKPDNSDGGNGATGSGIMANPSPKTLTAAELAKLNESASRLAGRKGELASGGVTSRKRSIDADADADFDSSLANGVDPLAKKFAMPGTYIEAWNRDDEANREKKLKTMDKEEEEQHNQLYVLAIILTFCICQLKFKFVHDMIRDMSLSKSDIFQVGHRNIPGWTAQATNRGG